VDRISEQICWGYQVIYRVGKTVLVKSLLLLSVIWLGPPGLAQTDSLERLFFTARERASMNRARIGTPDTLLETRPAITSTSRVDGFVERSSGTNTVWTDGRPRPEASGELNPQLVRTPAKITIQRAGNSDKRTP
jgi:hypothetical protein